MTTSSNERRSIKKEALLALLGVVGLLALFTLGAPAQQVIKDKDDKPAAKKDDQPQRSNIEVSGYTRPGNPDDKIVDGKIVDVSFTGANVQKFKIMGGTVYYSVFKNTGLVEGDTFGTGMANFDGKFEAGRSFKDSMSPRFDRKAKYLYLYEVVNDRSLGLTQVKGEKNAGGVGFIPAFQEGKIDKNAKVTVTDDIASFSLKLLADPAYITSWGHFHDAGFAANVIDTDVTGKPIKQVVDKQEVAKEIRLAVSHLPAIESKIPNPKFSRRARTNSLGELEAGFGVDKSTLNLQTSAAYGELKKVAGVIDKGNVKLLGFVQGLINATAETGREPEYVQLMYDPLQARELTPIIPGGMVEGLEDDITRAIFRVDWERVRSLKQGERSVVFGFTTDLPPVTSPIRIDTPLGAAASEGMRLANYFSEEVVARGTAEPSVIALTAAGGADAAMALSLGTALGQAPTPTPAPAAPTAGFAGITGGFTNMGGQQPSGGGGAAAPGWSNGIGLPGGGFGGGGGITGGGGTTGTTTGTTTPQAQTGTGTQTINFSATLTNQQKQQQKQGQFQIQNQHQSGHNRGGGGGHHGNVVPAPASLLLALLGLPGLWLLRRRKNDEAATETPTATA